MIGRMAYMKPIPATLLVALGITCTGIASHDAFALQPGTFDIVYEFVFPMSKVGALQLDSDYSAAGGSFEGSGNGVACTKAAGFGALEAFNDKDAAQVLTMAFANVGVAAPRDLATCRFNDADGDASRVTCN